jgi:hypothetical protein
MCGGFVLAFGQRNRPPPPGVAERQRLDHMLVHRLNRYIGVSRYMRPPRSLASASTHRHDTTRHKREGTVAMSWPTDAANRHFEAHTWPKLFQGVYLILCLHAYASPSPPPALQRLLSVCALIACVVSCVRCVRCVPCVSRVFRGCRVERADAARRACCRSSPTCQRRLPSTCGWSRSWRARRWRSSRRTAPTCATSPYGATFTTVANTQSHTHACRVIRVRARACVCG